VTFRCHVYVIVILLVPR